MTPFFGYKSTWGCEVQAYNSCIGSTTALPHVCAHGGTHVFRWAIWALRGLLTFLLTFPKGPSPKSSQNHLKKVHFCSTLWLTKYVRVIEVFIKSTPRRVSSHVSLVLYPEGIIPRVDRTGIPNTLIALSLSLSLHQVSQRWTKLLVWSFFERAFLLRAC